MDDLHFVANRATQTTKAKIQGSQSACMQKLNWRNSFCIASKLSAAATLVIAVALASDLKIAFASPITIDEVSQPNPYAYFSLGSGMNPSKQMTQLSSGEIGGQRFFV